MYTFKVPDASWNLEAWYKDKPVDPVINASWVNYGKGDFGSTAKDTEYRVKLVYNKGNVAVYVDGVKITEGKITDEKLFDGKLGFVFRDSVITVDDVRITKPIKIFDISDENSTAIKFRVATFNLGDFSTANGSSGDGIAKGNGTEVTKEEYRAVFERVGADVWGLQEDSQYFNGTTKESPFDAIYSTVHTNYERNFTGSYNGKAFLTSYDVYDVTPVYYTPIKTSYSGDSTVGYSHPWFLAGKVNVQGKEVTFITLHLEWRCKEQRFQQIKEILAYAKEQEYCIILGDFNPENYVNGEKVTDPNDIHNVNPGNVNMYQVDWKMFTDEGFEPANGGRFGVYGTLMTKGVAKNPLPWDNVFVSSNIKIKAAECVTESWMNDHAIFVADLELH
jgi:endonuclease/exonuclease/phosphatase family metal-dependent hydrolase